MPDWKPEDLTALADAVLLLQQTQALTLDAEQRDLIAACLRMVAADLWKMQTIAAKEKQQCFMSS